ncbi:MAG: hypothetical protein ACRCZ9_01605 [Fusobacteriaceae bacterium]
MEFNLTKKGVFKKTKNTKSKNDICRNWEDLFKEYRIAKRKQKKFKEENARKIKQTTYSTTTSDKKYTAMVASPELTDNVFVSELQKNAWLEIENKVESSRTVDSRVKKIENGKLIYKVLNKKIESIINYWYDDVICIKGDYVNMETGEFLLSKEFVFSVANDSNFITKLKVLDGELKELKIEDEDFENKIWLLSLQTAIKIKEKKEKCIVKIKQNSASGEKFRAIKVIILNCEVKKKEKESECSKKKEEKFKFFKEIKATVCYNKKNNRNGQFRLPFT